MLLKDGFAIRIFQAIDQVSGFLPSICLVLFRQDCRWLRKKLLLLLLWMCHSIEQEPRVGATDKHDLGFSEMLDYVDLS